jgi:hypothetical protein
MIFSTNEGVILRGLGLLELHDSEGFNLFTIINCYCVIYSTLFINKGRLLFSIQVAGMLPIRIGCNRIVTFR